MYHAGPLDTTYATSRKAVRTGGPNKKNLLIGLAPRPLLRSCRHSSGRKLRTFAIAGAIRHRSLRVAPFGAFQKTTLRPRRWWGRILDESCGLAREFIAGVRQPYSACRRPQAARSQ